jgi:hypothetical protein
MITDDQLLGIRKPNVAAEREIKVKLPVAYLVRLHVIKLTQNRAISDVVSQALDEYIQSRHKARQAVPSKDDEASRLVPQRKF